MLEQSSYLPTSYKVKNIFKISFYASLNKVIQVKQYSEKHKKNGTKITSLSLPIVKFVIGGHGLRLPQTSN